MKLLDHFGRMMTLNVEEKKDGNECTGIVRHGSNPKVEWQRHKKDEYNFLKDGNFLDHDHRASLSTTRNEREWRRTLACKLYEEQHNMDGSEGMDLLWETYERDSMKFRPEIINKNQNHKEHNDNDNEVEKSGHGQFGCLNVLKWNGRKINSGNGRPYLERMSKAIKGVGRFGHLRKKHSKKVHNNGSNRFNCN